MSEKHIEYAFNHIYNDAIKNPEKKDEESIKKTIMYYLTDLADRQRSEDISVVHDVFNKWDNTKSSSHGLDTILDRVINLIRNEIVSHSNILYENYQSIIQKTLK